MSDFKRIWDSSDKQYDFFDATTAYGTFSGLYGGDMKISMTSYNVVGENGGVITKHLPGQITYAPIKLTCSMSDVVKDLTDWFELARIGNFDNLRRNCSIAQYKTKVVKDDDGETVKLRVDQLVIWELINAIPIALPGFSYNSYQKTASTSFKVLIQAEEINLIYP